MAIDEARLNAFMGNFMHDMGAVMHAVTIVVGDQWKLRNDIRPILPANDPARERPS